MTPRAAISPAWLGLFALGSFGGLVLASFASGYHLVVKAASDAPIPASGAASAVVSTQLRQEARQEAVSRQGLTPDQAVVRSEPERGGILARLPANQPVTVLAREGLWARIEFARDGKSIAGWTLASNLTLR